MSHLNQIENYSQEQKHSVKKDDNIINDLEISNTNKIEDHNKEPISSGVYIIVTVHEKKEHYRCSICNFQFSNKGDLVYHFNSFHGVIYSGNEKIVCSICNDMVFLDIANLKEHIKHEDYITTK